MGWGQLSVMAVASWAVNWGEVYRLFALASLDFSRGSGAVRDLG